MHRLLERQNYRVAYWRVAFSAVNYRRFFDINDLAGLRVEHPDCPHDFPQEMREEAYKLFDSVLKTK